MALRIAWSSSTTRTLIFDGRGFFTNGISLGETLARLAASDAVVGLLLEITFIATFTQRFFA